MSNRDNRGYGIDLGANYEFSDKLSFNASILDLGSITWKSFTTTYANGGGQFSFDGIEISAYGDDLDSGTTSFDNILDSLEEAFDLKESSESYTTSLPTRFYLGANYKVTERDMLGGLIQGSYDLGKIRPAFSMNYARKMTKWITVATSYTVINSSYNNVGLGLNFRPGPIQFYIVSNNILGAFRPQHSRHFQLRFGLNLVFGAAKSAEIRPPYRRAIKKKSKEDEQPQNDSLVIPEIIIPENESADSTMNQSSPMDKEIDAAPQTETVIEGSNTNEEGESQIEQNENEVKSSLEEESDQGGDQQNAIQEKDTVIEKTYEEKEVKETKTSEPESEDDYTP